MCWQVKQLGTSNSKQVAFSMLWRFSAGGLPAFKQREEHPPLVFFAAQRLWIIQPRLLLQHLRQNLQVSLDNRCCMHWQAMRMNHFALQRNSSSSNHQAEAQSKAPPERSTPRASPRSSSPVAGQQPIKAVPHTVPRCW